MNRWLAGLAVILTGVCVVQGQANKGTSSEAALIDLENRWVLALAKADTAALDAVFAATYVDTDEGGDRTDKAGVLAVLKSGQLKMTSIKLCQTCMSTSTATLRW